MDAKLERLMQQGAEAEARARLERLLAKRDALATENYVRYCIGAAKRAGFDLLAGDVALVHPDDLPESVVLVARRDPVYAVRHPHVLQGKMLLVKKAQAGDYLRDQRVEH